MEDDADLARLYAAAATSAGLETAVVRSATEAEAYFGGRPCDALLADVMLPDATGFELVARLRRKPGGERFALVFVSGVVKAARHRDDAIDQLGALDLFEKPVSPDELVAAVQRAIADRQPTRPPAPPQELPQTSQSGIHFVSRADLASIAPPPGRMVAGRRIDLAQLPFFRVYARLAREKFTGLAHLRQGRVRKVATFREGRPVGVKSNLVSECLGRVMCASGLLSEAQCDASLEHMRVHGGRQGEALLALGWANRRSLEYALQLQLEQKLFDVFGWDGGECLLAADASGPDSAAWDVPLDLSPLEAVHEGLARSWRGERLRAALPAGELAVKPVDLPDPVTLAEQSPELAATCSLVNGLRSIDDLLGAGSLPPQRAAALLLALDALGHVLFAPRAPEEEVVLLVKRASRPPALPLASPPARPPDRAEAALLEQLEAHLSDLSRRTHYEVLGVPRDATPHAIRDAWLQLGRDFHPDRWAARASPAVRLVAERIFDRIAEAHALLADPVERRRYGARIDARNAETDADRAERILRADEAFRLGRARLSAGQPADAEQAFAEASALYPEDALFHAYLGLASFHADAGPDAAGRALAHLRHARELQPKLPEAHLFEATVRQALGEEARAAEELARVEVLLEGVRGDA